MSAFSHRELGVIGAILTTPITTDLVADKIHLRKEIFQLLLNIKGSENIVLITDSIFAAGLKDGTYDFDGRQFIVDDNSVRLEDGTLAGSKLTLNKAVKNIYDNTNLNIAKAIELATINPAKVLHIDDFKGTLHKGKDADIILFDNNFNIVTTLVNGEIVYNTSQGQTPSF